jgi:hypothetical protein
MPRVRFEPTSPVFKLAKTVHALDPEATVIGTSQYTLCVQVLLGVCSLKIQDVNYFQNFTLFIQNSLLLNQYIAGLD